MDGVVIWGEVLFCIDFSMDFCALYFMCSLFGWKPRYRRLIAASACCAAAGVLSIAVSSGFLSALLMIAGWGFSAILLIPPTKRRISTAAAAFLLFLFLEACAGGIMTALFYFLNRQFSSYGFIVTDTTSRCKLFFLCTGLIFIVIGIVFRTASYTELQKLVTAGGVAAVQLNGKETCVPCLFDSGNLVREPISGKPVIVLPYREQHQLGIDPSLLEKGMLRGCRLIPLKTLGRTFISWGIRPEHIRVHADNLDIPDADFYIVFSRETEQAIVPASVLLHYR